MTNSASGVLVVDKPAGPTSHDVVDVVRRALGVRRVGHTGTLDPLATGVLPICVGKATRLVQFLSGGEKVYRAGVRLGFATTTDDALGEPLGPAQPVAIDRARLVAATRDLLGEILQVPPAFSAKRTDGERHYDLARAGRLPERRPCRVTVNAIELRGEPGADAFEIEVRCSAGTYVRALARDIGERLGTGGHLTALRRLKSGPFGLEHAISLDDVRAGHAPERLFPLGHLLPELPAVVVGSAGLEWLRHGRNLTPANVLSGFPQAAVERVRVVDETGALLALARPRGFETGSSGLPVEPTLHPDIVLVD